MKTKVLAVAMALAALLSVFAAGGIAGGSDATTETLLGTGSNDLATANYYKTDDTIPIPFIDLSLTTVAHPQYSVKVTFDSDDKVLMEASTVGASTPMRIGLTQYLHENNSTNPDVTGGIDLSSFTEYKIWFKASDAASYGSNYVTLKMTTYTVTPAVATTGLAAGDTEDKWKASILDGSSAVSAITVYAGTVVTLDGSSFTVTDSVGVEHVVTATAPTAIEQTDKYTYSFVAWNDISAATVTITDNTTLTANFTAVINQHKVYIDSAIVSVVDGESNSYVSGDSVDYGTALTIDATRTGYTPTIKVNGTAQAAGNTADFTMGTVDLIITADFAAVTPTVTFKATDATTTYAPVAVQQTYDALYDFNGVDDPVKTGYSFIGWKLATSDKFITEDATVDIVADEDAVAQWVINTYTVSYNVDSISSVTAGGDAVANHSQVAFGTALVITIVDKAGYTEATIENNATKSFTDYTVPAYNVVLDVAYAVDSYGITLAKAASDEGVDAALITLKESGSAVASISSVEYGTPVLIDGVQITIGTHVIVSDYTGTSTTLAFGVKKWTVKYGAEEEVVLNNGDLITGEATIKVYYESFDKGTFAVTVNVVKASAQAIADEDFAKISAVITGEMLAGEEGILKIRNYSGKAFTYEVTGATNSYIAEGVYKISGIAADTVVTVTVSNAVDANLRAFYITSMSGSDIGVYIETNDDRFPSGAVVSLTGMGYIMAGAEEVRTYIAFSSASAYNVTGQINPSAEVDGGVSFNDISFSLKNQWGKVYTAYSVTATYTGGGQTASTSKVLA